MFNGIIAHTGKIKKIIKSKNNCVFEIKSKIKFTKKEIGSSVSCSGACLTLEKYNKNISRFYLSSETLNRTIFKYSSTTVRGRIVMSSISHSTIFIERREF